MALRRKSTGKKKVNTPICLPENSHNRGVFNENYIRSSVADYK